MNWYDDAGLHEAFACVDMSNRDGSPVKARRAIITHMEEDDRYRVSPGKARSDSVARAAVNQLLQVSEVSEKRSGADLVMTPKCPEECCTGQRRRHKGRHMQSFTKAASLGRTVG